MTLEELATRLVRDLFINGAGQQADRLVMMRDGEKGDLGGWSEKGAIWQLTRTLGRELLVDEITPGGGQ